MKILEKRVVTHHIVLTEEERNILSKASAILWNAGHEYDESDEDVFLDIVKNRDIYTFSDLSLVLDSIFEEAIIEKEED